MSAAAKQFLDRLEQLGLLEDEVLADLRKQVATSKFEISAEAVGKLLVDGGHLTEVQSKKLLAQHAAAGGGASGAPAGASGGTSAGAKKPADAPVPAPAKKPVSATIDQDDELGFADLGDGGPGGAKPADKGAPKVADKSTEKASGGKPADAGAGAKKDAGKKPAGKADDAGDIILLEETPAAAPAASAPAASKPAGRSAAPPPPPVPLTPVAQSAPVALEAVGPTIPAAGMTP
ncbi:MAG TPA: hypothetical protein PLV92_25150, partial [Pirellulaceae bacterium]|nr:hypothetical protein [Pirellulaceae bacterium]